MRVFGPFVGPKLHHPTSHPMKGSGERCTWWEPGNNKQEKARRSPVRPVVVRHFIPHCVIRSCSVAPIALNQSK